MTMGIALWLLLRESSEAPAPTRDTEASWPLRCLFLCAGRRHDRNGDDDNDNESTGNDGSAHARAPGGDGDGHGHGHGEGEGELDIESQRPRGRPRWWRGRGSWGRDCPAVADTAIAARTSTHAPAYRDYGYLDTEFEPYRDEDFDPDPAQVGAYPSLPAYAPPLDGYEEQVRGGAPVSYRAPRLDRSIDWPRTDGGDLPGEEGHSRNEHHHHHYHHYQHYHQPSSWLHPSDLELCARGGIIGLLIDWIHARFARRS